MVGFYLDENVNGAIVKGLRRRGVDVLTVEEDGRASISDPEVLRRATELGRVLFTQDDDLLAEAALYWRSGTPFPGVIYARQRDVPVGVCICNLELIGLAGEPEEFRDRVTYLPL